MFYGSTNEAKEFRAAVDALGTVEGAGFLSFDISENADRKWLSGKYPSMVVGNVASLQFLNKKSGKWVGYSTIAADSMLKFFCKKIGLPKPTEAVLDKLRENSLVPVAKKSNYVIKSDSPLVTSSVTPDANVKHEASTVERTIKNLQPIHYALFNVSNLARQFQLAPSQPERRTALNQVRENCKTIVSSPFGDSYFHICNMYVKAMEETFSVGEHYIAKEFTRLSGLLKSSLSAAKRDEIQTRAYVFRNFLESIPKIVHFIKTDGKRDNFNIVHYLSVRSAAYHIKADKFIFHCAVEPEGISIFFVLYNF